MAESPLFNFNYGIDPSLLSRNSGSSASMLQLGGYESPVQTSSASPGTFFSNLFGSGEGGMFSRQGILGGTDQKTGITTQGWAPIALGLGQAVLGGIQGSRATKLANDQFKEAKRQFDLNFNAQRQSINTQLEDRQRARVASNPGAYESTEDYLKKNRV